MAGRQVAHLLVRRHRGRGAVQETKIFSGETKYFSLLTCAGGSQRWAWPVLPRPTAGAARPEGASGQYLAGPPLASQPPGLRRGAASAGRAGLENILIKMRKIFHNEILNLPEPQTVPTFAAVEIAEPSSAAAGPSASAVVELSVGPPGLSAVSV